MWTRVYWCQYISSSQTHFLTSPSVQSPSLTPFTEELNEAGAVHSETDSPPAAQKDSVHTLITLLTLYFSFHCCCSSAAGDWRLITLQSNTDTSCSLCHSTTGWICSSGQLLCFHRVSLQRVKGVSQLNKVFICRFLLNLLFSSGPVLTALNTLDRTFQPTTPPQTHSSF